MAENNPHTGIDNEIADAILELPLYFEAGGKRYCIYPVTLGKSILIWREAEASGINISNLAIDTFAEALRAARERTEAVIRIIALATLPGKEAIADGSQLKRRADELCEVLDYEEAAQLLLYCLQSNKTGSFIKYLGLDKERTIQKRIAAVKACKGSVSFGGRSLYGILIDTACQRYGWTVDYVVWGISYQNIQMLLADTIATVYLTEEERKRLNLGDGGGFINADDPKNAELIKSMNWD